MEEIFQSCAEFQRTTSCLQSRHHKLSAINPHIKKISSKDINLIKSDNHMVSWRKKRCINAIKILNFFKNSSMKNKAGAEKSSKRGPVDQEKLNILKGETLAVLGTFEIVSSIRTL